MKESLSVRFLYRTVPGRIILKLLIHPRISDASALVLSSRISSLIVPFFVKKNGIDLARYRIPRGGYHSFNEFFTRRLRSPELPAEDASLICPCDGLLTVKPIKRNSVFHIKHGRYRLAALLKDKKLARQFRGGTALIFRLTPSHYHRYSYCTDGRIASQKRIDGVLHCVRPVALETTKVFSENSREYVVIEKENGEKFVQMEVGAMLVGRITNAKAKEGTQVKMGAPKGYFEYGGSTIIVLCDKKIRLNKKFKDRRRTGGEIPVVIGEKLV